MQIFLQTLSLFRKPCHQFRNKGNKNSLFQDVSSQLVHFLVKWTYVVWPWFKTCLNVIVSNREDDLNNIQTKNSGKFIFPFENSYIKHCMSLFFSFIFHAQSVVMHWEFKASIDISPSSPELPCRNLSRHPYAPLWHHQTSSSCQHASVKTWHFVTNSHSH